MYYYVFFFLLFLILPLIIISLSARIYLYLFTTIEEMFRHSSIRFITLVEAKAFLGLPTLTTTVPPLSDGNSTSAAKATPSDHHSSPFSTGTSGKGGANTTHYSSATSSSSTSLRAPLVVPTILEILKAHHLAPEENLFSSALGQLVANDRTSIDSSLVALCRVPAQTSRLETGHAGESSTASMIPNTSSTTPVTQNVVVFLMNRYPHSILIQEYGCRCIANMCLLSLPTGASPPPTIDVAEELITDGALSAVLRTVRLGKKLSRRGQGWAAMALLNLLCLSQSGASRAVVSSSSSSTFSDFSSGVVTSGDGVDALTSISTFILALLDEKELLSPGRLQKIPLTEETANCNSCDSAAGSFPSFPTQSSSDEGSPPKSPSSLSCFPADLVTAVDAAVGALAILLQQEAPENAKGIRVWSESAPFVSMKALCQSLLLSSALLVRDGRNNGVYSASLPQRRSGLPFQLHKCSPHQSTAIIALLPWLHKNWIAMRQLCRCTANVPLIWEAFRDLVVRKKKDEGTPVKKRKFLDAEGKEGVVSSQETETKDCYGSLSAADTDSSPVFSSSSSLSMLPLLEASLFVLTELEGLEKVQHLYAALVQIHSEICECMMEVFSIWTELPPLSSEEGISSGRPSGGEVDVKTTGGATSGGSSRVCDLSSSCRPSPIASEGRTSFPPSTSSCDSSLSSARLRLETMRTGTISSLALATVVRIHSDICDARQKSAVKSLQHRQSAHIGATGTSTASPIAIPLLQPYDRRQHAVLWRGLETLHHLVTARRRNSHEGGNNEELKSELESGMGVEKKNASSPLPSSFSTPPLKYAATAVDDVGMSMNTVAALQVMLNTGAQVLRDIITTSVPSLSSSSLSSHVGMERNISHRAAFIEELSYLFEIPTSASASSNSAEDHLSSREEKNDVYARREAQAQLLLQEAAIVGQVCSILYSFLQEEKGARILLQNVQATATSSLRGGRNEGEGSGSPTSQEGDHSEGVLPQILAIQELLDTYFSEALKHAKKRFSEKSADACSTKGSSSWSVTRLEETLVCLTQVVHGLLKSLQGLQAISSRSPVTVSL